MYLAIGDPCVAKNCALKECRAEAGELFGLCQFKLNEDYSEKTLVDLTIAEDVLYEDLNRQLENSADEIRNREVKKAVDGIMRKGYAKTPDVSDIKEKFTRWAAYTYARLLSKQIFVPVETEDKELMYSPFQCMAQYFLSLGYHTNTINKDIHYFVCANNKVDYRGSCPGRHYVRADAIEQVVMMELRRMAEYLSENEDAFAELLAQKTDKELLNEQKHCEEELQKAMIRNDTFSRLYEKLYEDNATGKVSDEWFMQLSHKYEVE